MADLVITAANVKPGADAKIETGYAGEALAAGKVAYKAANGRYMLADSNSGTSLARQGRGIVLNGAAADQPVSVQTGGKITIGAAVVAGTAYYLSDTPGGICPVADVGTGESVNLLGLASSATEIVIDTAFPGVTL